MSFLFQASASVVLAMLSALSIDWAVDPDDEEVDAGHESDWTIVDTFSSTEDESESDGDDEVAASSSGRATATDEEPDAVDGTEAATDAAKQELESKCSRPGCFRQFGLPHKLSKLGGKVTARAQGAVDRASSLVSMTMPGTKKRTGRSADLRTSYRTLKEAVSAWKWGYQVGKQAPTPLEASI